MKRLIPILFLLALPIASLPSAPAKPQQRANTPQVAAAAAVRPVVAPVSLAQVDGKWVQAETRSVQALVYVDGDAKYVQVRARRVVTVTIDGQRLDVLSAAAVPLVEVATEAGRCYGLAAPAGKYHVEVLSIDPDAGILAETVEVTIGTPPGPDPDDPDDPDPPAPSSEWAKVLSDPAKAANLTNAEAKVMASAFRAAASGSHSTVAELTGAASKQYTDQLGINRTTELLDFRQAIVAELRRLSLTTVDQYKAEFGKLAAALEAIQ